MENFDFWFIFRSQVLSILKNYLFLQYIFYTLIAIFVLLLILILVIIVFKEAVYKSINRANELNYKNIEMDNRNNIELKKLIEGLLERLPEKTDSIADDNKKFGQLIETPMPIKIKDPTVLYNEANRLFVERSDSSKINEFKKYFEINSIGVKDPAKQYEAGDYKSRVLVNTPFGRMFCIKSNNVVVIC